jgi:cytochrome c biogenesis protein CcmG/thiol:disulfide interchange protein DsbE
MKNKLFLTLAVVLFAGASMFAQKSLPDVNVKTLDGQTVNLKETYGQADGKVTIFSFWATWCSPCKKELDALADIYPEWQEDHNVELVAITIDTRRALAKVPVMVETKGWEYTILAGDQQEMQNAFNFSTIPQTFVVDKEGNIAFTHNGYVPGDEYELEEVVKELTK